MQVRRHARGRSSVDLMRFSEAQARLRLSDHRLIQVKAVPSELREIRDSGLGVAMTNANLKRVPVGQLLMHVARQSDVAWPDDPRDTCSLESSFGPLECDQRTSVTMTEITPLGRGAIKHLGFEVGARNSSEHLS